MYTYNRHVIISAFVVGAPLFFFFPLVTTLFLLTVALFLEHKINYHLIIIALIIAITPYVITKTNIPFSGNDKQQYLHYIDSFSKGKFWNVIKTQPEFFSFGTLKLLSAYFSPQLTLLFFFIFSFTLLFYGVYFIERKAIPLYFLVAFSSTYFLLLYGNVIRQGLAFSFLVIMLSQTGWRRKCIFGFAVLCHLSMLMFIPFLFLGDKKFKKKGLILFLFCTLAYIFSNYFVNIFSFLSIFGFASLSSKAELYLGWGEYDINSTKNLVYLIVALTLSVFLFEKLFQEGFLESRRYKYLSNFLIVSLPILLFSLAIPKVFERIFLYVIMISFLFYSTCIYNLKAPFLKYTALTSLSFMLFLLSIRRFHTEEWYFYDNSGAYLETNLSDLMGFLF